MSHTVSPPQLVLCIPGPWETRSDSVTDIVQRTEGQYIFAGRLLMHVATQKVFEVEFEPRDERMLRAFAAVGPHWRDSPDMQRIDSHRSVAYLLGHGGTDQDVQALMLAAKALLDAGGLGVKVESTGLAHSPAAWRGMCEEFALFSPYRAFVVVVNGPGEAYSCGMHTFGMHDVRVMDEDKASASQTAQVFSRYLFTERPAVQAGQTFACAKDAPVYRIASSEGVDYEPDSLFINPYGTWRLQRP